MKQTGLLRKNLKRGQAVISVVLLFLLGTMAVLSGVARPVSRDVSELSDYRFSKQSYYAAESGVEDVIYRLQSGMNVPDVIEIQNGYAFAVTSVSDMPGGKELSSVGDLEDRIRKISVVLTQEAGTVFTYATQVGSIGLSMSANSRVNGDVYSNGNITGNLQTVIAGNAYAVGSISSPRPAVSGTKQAGAPIEPMPEIGLDYWRGRANINNDPNQGSISWGSGSHSLGPKKVVGSLSMTNDATLTITGPLHITGNLFLGNSSVIYLSPSFGSKGVVVVVDGTISFNSNTRVFGTGGNPEGYPVFLSASNSSSAINLNSNASLEATLYAVNGRVNLNSNGNALAIAGQGINLNSNAVLNYDAGLKEMLLYDAPMSNLEIEEWKEVE